MIADLCVKFCLDIFLRIFKWYFFQNIFRRFPLFLSLSPHLLQTPLGRARPRPDFPFAPGVRSSAERGVFGRRGTFAPSKINSYPIPFSTSWRPTHAPLHSGVIINRKIARASLDRKSFRNNAVSSGYENNAVLVRTKCLRFF